MSTIKKATNEEIAEALKQRYGNLRLAAMDCGICRNTIYNRANNDPELKAVLDESREEFVDICEDELLKAVLDGNITAIIFALKTRGKSRGYVEKQESEHSGKVNVELSYVDDAGDLD